MIWNIGLWELSLIIVYIASLVIVLLHVSKGNSYWGCLYLLLPLLLGPIGLIIYLVLDKIRKIN